MILYNNQSRGRDCRNNRRTDLKIMSQSGVTVAEEFLEVFEEMKTNKRYRWAIFKLSDDMKTVIPDTKDSGADSFSEFLDKLKQSGEPRYAVYDVPFTRDGQPKAFIVFIAWTPELSKIRLKMIYASSKDAVKKALQLNTELQIQEDDFFMEQLIEKAKSGLKD